MAHVLAKHLREAVLNNAIKGDLSNTLESDTKIENTISQLIANKKGYKWEKGKKKIVINPITDKDREAFSTRYALVRLGDIVSILGRIGFRGFVKEDFVEKSNFICLNPGNLLPVNKMSYSKLSYIREEKYAESPEIQIENGDILIVKTGSSYGKCAIIENLNAQATINPQLVRIVSHGVNKKYLLYVFASKVGKDQFEDFVTGTATPTFSQEKLSNFLVPFPPIEEQARIVTRVDELMTKIDEYEKLENELVELKKNFPGDMKAAVLQTAMQGKLTEQLESDSDVFETLSKIKQMKEDLCKSKVIKKDIVYDAVDELYDIPDNWIWTHVGEVCVYAFNGKSPEYVKTNNGNYTLGQAANQNDGIHFEVSKFCSDAHKNKCDEYQFLKENDTLLNTLGGGSVGRVGIFHNPENYNCLTDGHIFVFRTNGMIDERYFFYYMKSNQKEFERMAEGSTNQSFLKLPTIKNYPFPLPPIEEQRRIVEKLDQLLPLCEELVNLC